MPSPLTVLYFVLGISIVLLVVILLRPSLTISTGGKILAFVAFVVLPVACGAWGLSEHYERSKETSFCLSCHIMQPYGQSLYVDDPNHIPAAHFQNHRVPADEACYTCHTNYGMYGGFQAKLNGLHHVYVQYFGQPHEPLHLYEPFNNRECLHCHADARSFENEIHMAMIDQLKSNHLSCISSGCHDTIHGVDALSKFKTWRPTE